MADDHELWERICSRDANAFEVFYRDNSGALTLICGRLSATCKPLNPHIRMRWRVSLKRNTGSGRTGCLKYGSLGWEPWRLRDNF